MNKLDIIKDGNEIHEELKKNIDTYQEKAKYTIGDKEIKMTKARANLNALVMSVLPEEFHKKEYLFLEEGSESNMDDYEQMIADTLFDLDYDLDRIKEIIFDLKEMIMKHIEMFNMHVNVDISTYDFIRMARMDEEIEDIMTGDCFDESMSAYEVIDRKKELEDKIEKHVIENKIDPFYTMLASEAGMRRPQFFDIVIGIGIRPYRKEIYPYVIKDKWLNGLTSKENFWVENDSARNALILQKRHITKTGTFNKRVTMLNQPSYLNDDPDFMCDTIAFTEEKITEDNYERFIQTYHMVDDKPELITRDNIKDLIGETIALRQPLTCASEYGICRYCIGDQFYFDNLEGYKGGEKNIGSVITKQKIAPRVQGYLSAKHNNTANLDPVPIKSDDWDKYFDIHCLDTLNFKNDLKGIYFDGEINIFRDKIEKDTIKVSSNKMTLVFNNGKEKTFETEKGSYFYTFEEDFGEEEDEVLNEENVHVWITNSPVSTGYHTLRAIFIDNDGKTERAIKDLKDFMSNEKIVVPYLMIRNLIRDPDNLEERPDFSNKENPPMQIVTMQKAIKNMKELGLKLSIGWFSDMLSNTKNYRENKTKPTRFDILFKSRKDGV